MMTFAFTAMDQIVNQMAKIHYMFGGQTPFPIVFRASIGAGRAAAAQHSQSPHPLFINIAGLKVLMPSTPYDAKGLMKSAIRDNNPVVVLEDQMLGAENLTQEVPGDEYLIPHRHRRHQTRRFRRHHHRHLQDGPTRPRSRRNPVHRRHLR